LPERGGKKPFGFIHIADSATIQDLRGEGCQAKFFGETPANRIVGRRGYPFVAGKRLLLFGWTHVNTVAAIQTIMPMAIAIFVITPAILPRKFPHPLRTAFFHSVGP
jgi:hypothetical protein